MFAESFSFIRENPCRFREIRVPFKRLPTGNKKPQPMLAEVRCDATGKGCGREAGCGGSSGEPSAEAALFQAVVHSPHPFPSKVVMRGDRPVS